MWRPLQVWQDIGLCKTLARHSSARYGEDIGKCHEGWSSWRAAGIADIDQGKALLLRVECVKDGGRGAGGIEGLLRRMAQENDVEGVCVGGLGEV